MTAHNYHHPPHKLNVSNISVVTLPDFDQTLKVGSWEYLEQIPIVTVTFVQATFVLEIFVIWINISRKNVSRTNVAWTNVTMTA